MAKKPTLNKDVVFDEVETTPNALKSDTLFDEVDNTTEKKNSGSQLLVGGSTEPASGTAIGTKIDKAWPSNAVNVPEKKEFEKRIQDPKQFILNADGTKSTHRMASAEVDGKQIAYPTIVNINGKLKELNHKEALDYALKNNEYREFKTAKEAQAYAEGGYKQDTAMERMAGKSQSVTKEQVDKVQKELGELNPMGRIQLYTNALTKVNQRFTENVAAWKAAQESGDQETVAKLLPLIKEDGEKAAQLKKGIEGQKQLAEIKEPNTVANTMAIGLKSAAGLLLSAPKAFDDATTVLMRDAMDAVGLKGTETVKAVEQFREQMGDKAIDPMIASDFLGKQGLELLRESSKESQEKRVNLPYEGQGFEALKNGDIALASEYGAKSFLESLPTSLTFLNPYTAAASMSGMVGQEMQESEDEGRDINSTVVLAGTIKAGLEMATERMFGAGRAVTDLVKTLGKEGAEKVVREASEAMIKKSLIKKLGQTYGEEIIGEVANQFGSNVVDRYINGKEVNLTEGLGEAGWQALFGAGIQGTAPVVIKHAIDNKRAAQADELRATATDMMDKALHQEDPAVAQTMEKQADKLNTEADAIIESVNKIGDMANPETVARLGEINDEMEAIDKTILSPEITPVVKESLLVDKVALEKEHETLLKQAEKEVKKNEKELAATAAKPISEEGKKGENILNKPTAPDTKEADGNTKQNDQRPGVLTGRVSEPNQGTPDNTGVEEIKKTLISGGKIILDEKGNVQTVKQNSGEESQLFKDLSAITGDREKALKRYLEYKDDKGVFKQEFGDWENQIMKVYGRAGLEYEIHNTKAPNDSRYAWSETRPDGKLIIRFNEGKFSRDIPFEQQKQDYIDTVINPEIEKYRSEGNDQAVSDMEAYKALFEKNITQLRDLKFQAIHNELFLKQNEGKSDIQKNYIDSLKEVERLNKIKLMKDYFGEPDIYQHAGAEGINQFIKPGEKGYEKNDEYTGEGIYFSRDPQQVEKYAKMKDGKPGEGRDIYYTFLKSERPYYIADPQAQAKYPLKDSVHLTKDDVKALKALGYDSVIWSMPGRDKHEIVVFEPDQIKIIGSFNKGLINEEKTNENIPEGDKPTVKKKQIQEKIDSLGEGKPERKKRKLTQTMINKSNLRQEFKDSFGEDEIYYDTIPNDVTLTEANSIIDYFGEDQAIKELKNLGNGMKPAVRNTVAKVLIKKLQAEGDYETAISLREDLVKSATEQGQGVQSFAMWIDLEPETEVIKAQRMVNKDREKKEKSASKKLKKLTKGIREINKESAEEAVKKVFKQVDKVSEITVREKTRPADYGSKNKVVTKEKYLAAKKALRGKLFSAAIPPELIEIGVYHLEAGSRKFADFAEAMIDDMGKKVKPYLRSLYDKAGKEVNVELSTEQEIDTYFAEEAGAQWKQKVEKAIASGNNKEGQKAIAALQKVSKEEGLWGKYKKQAVSRLKSLTEKQIIEDIQELAPLQEFTDGLIKNLNQKIEEIQKEGPDVPAKKPRKSIEIIGDAFKNVDKYEDVWQQAQKEFQEKYKNKPEILAMIDAYFGEILETPFSDKLIEKSVKEGLSDMNKNISDIVVKHYTVQDYVKQSLAEKLIEQAGLEGVEAQQLADAVSAEFDRIATAKKKQLIDKVLTPAQRKKPEAKVMEDELIRLTNLGAFSDKELVKAYGDKMGWPKLTPEQVKKIEELATAVQEVPDGFKKFRAVEDLLAYQASIPGVSATDVVVSIWYANILSGQNTQLVNLVGNMANSTALYTTAVAQNPTSAKFIATGFVEGFKRGLLEAQATWQTGYSPIRGKVEVPATLERTEFWGANLNPANYLKYVRRLMVASDVIMFEAQKEMRAYQLAWKQAAKEDLLEPTQSQKDRALEILNKTDDVTEWAKEEAETEFQDEVDTINSSSASVEEKSKRVKQAEQDKKRRIYELVEERRGGDILEESATFAARGTYNYKPEGALGVLANVINQATEKVKPLKFIIPFTNIIANVANESLNYTPVGFARLAREGSITGNRKTEMSDQEKADLMTKAIIGTSLMIAAYVLSSSTGDDDEPLIQITGGGTGDYRKNYELAETGWQPYSIKVGNKWYSYQYTPLMLGLGFIGQIRDYETYRNEKMSDEGFYTKVAAAGGYTAKSLFDMTFLSSLNSTLSAVMDPRNEDRMEDLMKQFKTTAKGFVVPSIYTQTARELENWFDVPTKEVRGTYFGDILKDVPVARNQYYDKINALGEPIVPDTDKIVSAGKPSRIWQLIADKRAFIGVPSPKSTSAVVYDKSLGKDRYMTSEEFYKFVKMRGEGIKAYLEKNISSLEKKTPEQVQDIMKTVKARQTKIAKNKLFNN